jgi:hypothetical protein
MEMLGALKAKRALKEEEADWEKTDSPVLPPRGIAENNPDSVF